MEDDIAEQNVDIGTVKDELKLLKELAVTVIEGSDTATGSDAAAETQTTVAVSDWTAEPEYNGETAGIYTFTPVLDLPESLTLAEGITAPTITVAVEQKAVTQMARGAVLMLSSSGNTIDLSDTNPLTSGTGWSYDSGAQVYTIANNANVVITGSNAGSQRRVEVAADAVATIALDGASISGLGDNQSPLLLKSGAEVSLATAGDNILSAGGNCAGIQAPAGTTLIIFPGETRSFTVTGGTNGAGIGGGENEAGGNITINGKPVTVIGGANGAGIGGGANGAGGSVSLSGWVTAIGGTNGVAIGGGSGSSSHGSLSFGSYTNFRYWTNTSNSDPGGTGTHNSATAFPEGSLDTFKFIRIEPEAAPSNIINLSEMYPSTSSVGWSYDRATQVYTIANNADVNIINSSAGNQRRVEVTAGAKATITLDGASISVLDDGLSPLLLKNGAEVTLTLEGDNALSAGDNCAGIQAPAGTTLILGGEGSLSATGGENGAGIGGANSAGGTITIRGNVNVTATGGRSGAGIGGAIGAGGTIAIGGNANVTATGGSAGAGIGGANNASSGGVNAAGGTITIGDNANVTATGGYASAGIGGGQGGEGGNVRITGGTVKATHGGFACAIGAGNGSYGDGTLGFGSYTDFRYWTNTTSSDPGGDGTLNRVTPFPEASRTTFMYIKIAPESAVTVPSAPQSFTATPGDSQAVLSWAPPASNGNAEILRYEVSSNNGVSWVTAAGDTSHTFTGLTNGTSYTFKVRAVNSVGNGIEASTITTPTAGSIPPTNTQAPSISEQPTSATYTQNDTAVELAVTASVVDGGVLSYQWYSNSTNSTVGGIEVGTNSNTYTPSTATVGTTYYYCVVTNTNNEATANKTATATSDAAAVTVNASGGTIIRFITVTGIVEPVGGEVPVKTGATVPADANYALRENIVWVDDENTTEPMADGAKFEAGKHYHCGVSVFLPSGHSFASDVTATINGKTATVMLDGTKEAVVSYLFTAKDAADTPTITITKHPQNVTVTQGRINKTLTAEAVANNGKSIRYQWCRFIGGIGSDNTEPILGATSNTFTIPTGLTPGTYQYLCIFNTDGTDYVDSNTAIVTVNPPSGGSGSGDSGGGSSGGDGGSGIVVTPPAPSAPNAPTQGSVNIPGRVDGSGNVTANITNQAVSDAIDKALAQAGQNGTEQNGITLTINISTGGKPVNNFSANLPKEVQDAIIAKGVSGLIITTGGSDIAIGMDLAALREMNRQAGGNINLTATRMNNATLAGNARAAIGNRPVFDLKAIYGNGKQVQNFGAGSVSVTIPYTLGTGENTGNIQAVYVDANDRVQWLISSVYNGLNGVLRFSTNHFSTYGVGYKQGVPSFADIGTHWAKEDIAFVANRGLLSGTSKTTFSPNTAMTRGMFVTALGRLANADVSGYEKSSFTDVKSDSYHMGYVEWANKNNIVKGIGDGKFAPDQSITREQMAVILQSYAKAIGFTLPKVYAENTFADSAKIGAYAKDAVKQMQMAGIISGKNSNLFDPPGTATRAEVSAVLRRFVELAISSDTAQGWTMNDSGKWMYYENGKPVTGKKNIGGSTYTFDQYGVTADVPKNLRYTTYTVQKGDSFWLIAHKLGCTMSELERLNNKSRFDLIHPGDVLRVPEE